MSRYTDEFEKFWKLYPARWNNGQGQYVKRKKYPAFQRWQKLTKEIQQECLAKVHLVKKTEGSASSVRDAVTWLNQEGWDDIDLEPPKKSSLPPEITDKFIEATSVKEKSVDVNTIRNKVRKGLGVR